MNIRNKFLLENNLVIVPSNIRGNASTKAMFGTVISNMVNFGYIPNAKLYSTLSALDANSLIQFWNELKPAFESVTGANKKMDRHIVYKNFPQEILDMSTGEYWIKQILMYWGLPNDLFTQDEKPRDTLLENTKLKVLQEASSNSLQSLYDQLLGNPSKWTKAQQQYVLDLLATREIILDLIKIPFKENLVFAAAEAVKTKAPLVTRSAMDILRLGVALSDGDFSLKENSKFKSFSRSTRRFLLALLENASNLEEDMARDMSRWKKFMRALRPGDNGNRFPKVIVAYSSLYQGSVKSFNAQVETLISSKDEKVLALLENRPGDFMRRLQVLLQLFGRKAVKSFEKVALKLKIMQLLKLRRYFATIQGRSHRTIAPKGNWTKLKILPNEINVRQVLFGNIVKIIDEIVKNKIITKIPSVKLDPRVENVAIQGNDAELTPYGRNTKFAIPDGVTFIRTASYWKAPEMGNIWFDNGINFFDDKWNALGTCCWNSSTTGLGYSVFSGDPTSSKTVTGEACQMIDIYLDKAKNAGVRYAVWNILCYSGKSFDEVEAVHAAMQWGESSQKGGTFEPSRCQLSFPVKGKSKTKYIAIIDVLERQVIYIDANLKGAVHSAASNTKTLTETMPAYMEYLETQPTIMDLFRDIPPSNDGVPILYDDEGIDIKTKRAYVFKPLNENNEFTQINVSELLTL